MSATVDETNVPVGGGAPPTTLYVYDPAGGKWRALAAVDQGNGSAALVVTGAGAAPSATSLKIVGAGGVTAEVDATKALLVSPPHLTSSVDSVTAVLAGVPHVIVDSGHVIVDTLPGSPAQDPTVAAVTTSLGTDGAAGSPSAGTGVRGWLRNIRDLLAAPLTLNDLRGLTERMSARAPASGYHLWLDVLSSSSTYIYVAEAPDGTASNTTGFRGIRLAVDSNGNPLGAVQTATGFAWDSRAAATWSN